MSYALCMLRVSACLHCSDGSNASAAGGGGGATKLTELLSVAVCVVNVVNNHIITSHASHSHVVVVADHLL